MQLIQEHELSSKDGGDNLSRSESKSGSGWFSSKGKSDKTGNEQAQSESLWQKASAVVNPPSFRPVSFCIVVALCDCI